MKKRTLAFHPACEIFPVMEGPAFDELVEDIRTHGQREKILIDKSGAILDGRNRYRACQKLGIKPAITVWVPRKGDSVLALVVSLNIKRRHLTPSLKAVLAHKLVPMFAKEAKQRQRQHGRTAPGRKSVSQKVEQVNAGKAAEQAAKATGANRQYVSDVATLKKDSPDLYESVAKGERNVKQAKQERNNRKRAVRRAANEARIRASAPAETLTGLIESGARFASIVIDPPWSPDDSGIHSVFGRSEPDYATQTLEEIRAVPVPELADSDCHLYLWATHRTLRAAFDLLDAWGFRYVTALAWVKPHFGMGNYFRGQHEHVLFAVRGSQPLKRKDAGTVFHAPAGAEHSAKPEEFFALVESCSHAPYLELFGRKAREHWVVWGQDGIAA